MELSKFKTNLELEEEGVWVDLGEGFKIKVARSGNKKYQKSIREGLKPYRKAVKTGNISDDVLEKVMTKGLAEAVLLDWEGLTENKKKIAYSPEKALEILSDPALKDFRDLVVELSEDAQAFKDEEQEDDLKN